MILIVTNLYTDKTLRFEGDSQQVAKELLRVFPFLRAENPELNDLDSLLEHLGSEQVYDVHMIDPEDSVIKSELQPNNDPKDRPRPKFPMVEAWDRPDHIQNGAEWLSGVKANTSVSNGLKEIDPIGAALMAHGLEITDENRQAIQAFIDAQSQIKPPKTKFPSEVEVKPGTQDAVEAAESIQKAFNDRYVTDIALGGKHSAGSLLVEDVSEGVSWLLKPGSGANSSAKGVDESSASQSQREACFYELAKVLGLDEYVPPTYLVLLDGVEYAAIRLLPWNYVQAGKLDNQKVAKIIQDHYSANGLVFKFAILDAISGNPDRHSGNILVHDNHLMLIDHGSAFAGKSFHPGQDPNAYMPFYLRAGYNGDYSKLSAEEKLKYFPKADTEVDNLVQNWVDNLKEFDIERVLATYGIDSGPTIARLEQFKKASDVFLRIQSFWLI